MLLATRPPTVSIGLIAPLTGPSDYIGRVVVNGTRLAVERYADLPSDISILEPFDDKGEPAAARQGFDSLEKQRCVAILGPVDSSCAAEVAARARAKHLVAVSPAATASYLVDSSNDWFFRVHSSDRHRTNALASLLSERHPGGSVLIMHEARHKAGGVAWLLYGEQQAADLRRSLSKTGLKLTESVPLLRNATPEELRSLVSGQHVKWSDVNAVVLLGLSRDTLKLVKVLRSLKDTKAKPIYLISPNREQFEAARPQGPIYAVTDTVHEIARYRPYEDFKAAYRIRFPDDEFSEYAAFAYDAANIVLSAVAEADRAPARATGSLKLLRQSVRDAIATTPQGRQGVVTNGSFSPEHELNLQSLILRLDEGHWAVVTSLPEAPTSSSASTGIGGWIDRLEKTALMRAITMASSTVRVIAAVLAIIAVGTVVVGGAIVFLAVRFNVHFH